MAAASDAPIRNQILLRFDRALKAFAATLVVALLIAVTAGVISRAANRPLSWTDEASGYIMVWLACAGWMLATRHNAHIRIRYFLDLFPPRLHTALIAALLVGTCIFGLVLSTTSIVLVRVNWDIEATTLPVTAAWLYAPLVPAGLVTLAQAIADLVAIKQGTYDGAAS